MDPNANLKEVLDIARRGLDRYRGSFQIWDVDRLAELVIALDEWIRKGGAIPNRWLAARLENLSPVIKPPICDTPRGAGRDITTFKMYQCILEKGHEGPHVLEVE